MIKLGALLPELQAIKDGLAETCDFDVNQTPPSVLRKEQEMNDLPELFPGCKEYKVYAPGSGCALVFIDETETHVTVANRYSGDLEPLGIIPYVRVDKRTHRLEDRAAVEFEHMRPLFAEHPEWKDFRVLAILPKQV